MSPWLLPLDHADLEVSWINNVPSHVYIYVDETGDTGFRFERSSSTHFAVALIALENPESIRKLADQVRRQLRWPLSREFKFSGTHDEARGLYLRTLCSATFQIHAMIFDKRRLTPIAVERDFYGHLVGLAFSDLIGVVTGAHLVLDESFKGKQKQRTFRTQLRTRIAAPGHQKLIGSLSYRSSHTDDALQLADMVVGALGRLARKGDDRYQRLIQARIVSERHYP